MVEKGKSMLIIITDLDDYDLLTYLYNSRFFELIDTNNYFGSNKIFSPLIFS